MFSAKCVGEMESTSEGGLHLFLAMRGGHGFWDRGKPCLYDKRILAISMACGLASMPSHWRPNC